MLAVIRIASSLEEEKQMAAIKKKFWEELVAYFP
jgi:hypothetical protein